MTTLAPFLPSPWSHQDIGAIGVGGYSKLDNSTGIFTIVGSGADVWNNADAFQYAEEPLTGDGEIVARVDAITPTDPWTKAGIMLRETNDPGACNAFIYLTPGNGVNLQARTSTGGSSVYQPAGQSASGTVWLKLIRQGNLITGFQSPTVWLGLWSGVTPCQWPVRLRPGLAITSHQINSLATATIDNVSVVEGVSTETQPSSPPPQPTVQVLGDVSITFTWPAANDPVG